MEEKLKELQKFLDEMQDKLKSLSEEINKKPRERWLIYKNGQYIEISYATLEGAEEQIKGLNDIEIVHFIEVKE